MASLNRDESGCAPAYHSRGYAPPLAKIPELAKVAKRNPAMTSLIAGEIIPRLSEASGIVTGELLAPYSLTEPEIEAFTQLAGFGRAQDLDFFTARLIQREGHDAIVLDLLAATAHKLGQQWVEDKIDFATVTIGVCRLQSVLHRLSDTHAQRTPQVGAAGPVYLAACPGEQHDFGLLLVAEFMRRAGIDVKFKAAATEMDILHAVSTTNVQIAGLSLSREAMIPRLESLISSIRKKSRNSDIRIMVGGRVFLDNPDLVRSVGADLKAVDGRDAVTQAKKVMLQLMPEMAIG